MRAHGQDGKASVLASGWNGFETVESWQNDGIARAI